MVNCTKRCHVYAAIRCAFLSWKSYMVVKMLGHLMRNLYRITILLWNNKSTVVDHQHGWLDLVISHRFWKLLSFCYVFLLSLNHSSASLSLKKPLFIIWTDVSHECWGMCVISDYVYEPNHSSLIGEWSQVIEQLKVKVKWKWFFVTHTP